VRLEGFFCKKEGCRQLGGVVGGGLAGVAWSEINFFAVVLPDLGCVAEG
jgi:hypothetical protein